MQLCWKQALSAKIHLVILRDTQYPILQFFYVFLQGFTEGCPPDLWINEPISSLFFDVQNQQHLSINQVGIPL